jgi:hypothetical protein
VLGSYASFNEGVQGKWADHQCLWIDVQLESVFGHKTSPLICYAKWRVKTNDPRITTQFNQLYCTFLLERNMPIWVLTLEQQASYPLHLALHREAEMLDKLKVEGFWYADQHCCCLFIGNVPFSLEYKCLTSTIRFWNSIIHQQLRLWGEQSKKKRKALSSHLIQSYAMKVKITERIKDIMQVSVKDNELQCLNAYECIQKVQKSCLERTPIMAARTGKNKSHH